MSKNQNNEMWGFSGMPMGKRSRGRADRKITATLDFPLTYTSLRLNGPTLFYIDQEGTPIQLGLNDKQVQAVIDDWNAEPGDSTSHTLKPPRT